MERIGQLQEARDGQQVVRPEASLADNLDALARRARAQSQCDVAVLASFDTPRLRFEIPPGVDGGTPEARIIEADAVLERWTQSADLDFIQDVPHRLPTSRFAKREGTRALAICPLWSEAVRAGVLFLN
jgi:hypothetical protein